MTSENTPANEKRGHELINRAHMLTKFRHESAPALGAYIAISDESHVTSAIHTAEVVTDWLDGYYARAGANILGIETTEKGKIDDPKADKRLVGSVLLGLTVRYARRGDWRSAAVCGANSAVDTWRNKRMDNSRAAALKNGVSPAAITINKAKMAIQASAELLLTSKAARGPKAKTLGLVALTVGTTIGVAGQLKFHRNVMQQQRANALACPDKIEPRNAPDDTIPESSLAVPEDQID